MRIISHHIRYADAETTITRLLGGSDRRSIDPVTWASAAGLVYGIRDGGPSGYAVAELTRAEGTQLRIDALARLVDEHLGWADAHDRRAVAHEASGEHGFARARRAQASAHRRLALESLQEMRSLVIETTGVDLGEGEAA